MKRLAMVFSLVILGFILIAILIVFKESIPATAVAPLWFVAFVTIVGGPLIGLGLKKISLASLGEIEMSDVDHEVDHTARRELPREVEVERRDYAAQKEQQLPGLGSPRPPSSSWTRNWPSRARRAPIR